MPDISKLQSRIKELEKQLETANSNLVSAVSEQTQNLTEQADFFRILYDIALSLSSADNEMSLFEKIVHSLRDLLNAKSVLIRLLDDNNKLLLMASVGITENNLPPYKVSTEKCLCGEAIIKNNIIQRRAPAACACASMDSKTKIDMIAVPIKHKAKILGVYNVNLNPESPPIAKNLRQLLSYIGVNIGMALEKFNIEKQKRENVVYEERVKIAHEIHDSLAQTIASLKLRSQILEKSIYKDDKKNTANTLLRIKHGINQANHEIRKLIRNFRATSEIQSLNGAIKSLIQQFRKENDIYIYLHYQSEKLPFSLDTKTHIYRIIQEVLTNISKHSKAHFVRIMANTDAGNFKLLIEDDGRGFEPAKVKTEKGKHVGIKFMQERADFIGAKLSIDSEPGEGCRVKLDLPLSVNSDLKQANLA